MSRDLPPERLTLILDWVEGRLDHDASARLDEAMAGDTELREDVAWVRGLLQTAEAMPLVQPPELLRQKLRQQYRRWTEAEEVSAPPILELPASLVFDSRHDRLTLATRGQPADQPVHLVWRTAMGDLVVDARLSVADDIVRISGQVLLGHATSAPVFEIIARGPGFALTSVHGDSHGRFRHQVPRTVEELYVSNGEFAIVAAVDLDAR